MIGRYVTVVIPGEKKTLTLCEIEVYGTSVLGMSVEECLFYANRISQSVDRSFRQIGAARGGGEGRGTTNTGNA